MPYSIPLSRVIDRINAIYGSWKRDTSIETMRTSWDKLFAGDLGDVQLQDLEIKGMKSRWIRAAEVTSPAAVLYIHGGGFRLGSVNSHQKLMSDIATASGCQVLGINYRLLPDYHFPAPLEDVLTAYRWLLDQGFNSEHIIIAGDSAGGGLAASLLQLIRQQEELPMPGGVVLLSPWLDMTLSGDSYDSRAEQDPVHQKKMLQVIASQYAGDDNALDTPLLSPLFGDLRKLPPTLIQVGDCEVGLDDSVSYSREAEAAGSPIQLSIWPEMIHVFQMFADDLEPGREAIQEISVFIRAIIEK